MLRLLTIAAGTGSVFLALAVAAQQSTWTPPRSTNGMPAKAPEQGKPAAFKLGASGDPAPAQPAGTVQPQVTNGVEVLQSDWPATLKSSYTGCTATAVGSRAILLAAHCLKFGLETIITAEDEDRHVSCATEGYSSDYDDKKGETKENWDKVSADYALCFIKDPKKALKKTKFETIRLSPVIAANDVVRLIGYGCNGDKVLSEGDGRLRTASSVVARLPEGNNNFFELKADAGYNNGILCSSDSGGAAYFPFQANSRKIIGVNSRTGLKEEKKLNGISYIASLSTPPAAKFITTWAGHHNIKVCGATPSNENCR
jgi:hypothetical protein